MVQLRNSASQYGAVTKALHWSVFLLIAYQFASGLSGNVDDDVHGSIGIFILGLMALRVAWRWTTRLPDWSPTLRPWERRLAHRVEQALYLFVIAKATTGLFFISADGDEIEFPFVGELPALWIESDFWEDFFETAHAWTGYVLLLAIALHVGLVLKHQLVDRDRFANRMLPFTRQ